jgi:hypothetical protein
VVDNDDDVAITSKEGNDSKGEDSCESDQQTVDIPKP